jgi:hypothetical protein
MIAEIISGVCTDHERHCAVGSYLLLLHLMARYLPEEPFIKKSLHFNSEKINMHTSKGFITLIGTNVFRLNVRLFACGLKSVYSILAHTGLG